MQEGLIKVTTGYERFVHWMLAISCLLLCFTGMGMMYKELNFFGAIFGGLKGLKVVHNYTASHLAWLWFWPSRCGGRKREFCIPEDWEWFKTAGGYLWHVDKVAETGKYNPGQKMFFLTVAFFGMVMIGSGFFMLYPQYISANLLDWMYPLHALGFLVIFAFFFVHLYLGTIGNPGTVQAMFTGWVTRAWLKKQHPGWLREMEHEGTLTVSNGK